MKTFLNKSFEYILVGEKQTFIIGKKLVKINYGSELLSGNTLPVLGVQELYINNPALGKGDLIHNFYDNLGYSFTEESRIFYNLQSLLIAFFQQKYNATTIIGFHFKRSIYICRYSWLKENYYQLFGMLSDSWIEIFKELNNNIYGSYHSETLESKTISPIEYIKNISHIESSHIYRVSRDGNVHVITNYSDNRTLGFQKNTIITNSPKANTIGKYMPKLGGIINNSGTRYSRRYGLYCTVSRYGFSNTMDVLNKGSSGLSVGTSTHKDDSKTKSFAEGFERYYSSYTNWDHENAKTGILGKEEHNLIKSITGYDALDFKIGESYISYPIYELKKIEENMIHIGNEFFIPGALIQYPHIENNLYSANSSGIAAGKSYIDAIINSYLEILERHYIVYGWLHAESPLQIIKETLPLKIQEILKNIEYDFKGKINIFCIGTNPVPSVLIFFQNKKRIKNMSLL